MKREFPDIEINPITEEEARRSKIKLTSFFLLFALFAGFVGTFWENQTSIVRIWDYIFTASLFICGPVWCAYEMQLIGRLNIWWAISLAFLGPVLLPVYAIKSSGIKSGLVVTVSIFAIMALGIISHLIGSAIAQAGVNVYTPNT